mmetsp:Transcript_14208/g.26321  ORF Transcript_14208/g.26321 Transcript_14208/m.26321 type:complete len:232 (+) Transcript_14208:1593-2288(+)
MEFSCAPLHTNLRSLETVIVPWGLVTRKATMLKNQVHAQRKVKIARRKDRTSPSRNILCKVMHGFTQAIKFQKHRFGQLKQARFLNNQRRGLCFPLQGTLMEPTSAHHHHRVRHRKRITMQEAIAVQIRAQGGICNLRVSRRCRHKAQIYLRHPILQVQALVLTLAQSLIQYLPHLLAQLLPLLPHHLHRLRHFRLHRGTPHLLVGLPCSNVGELRRAPKPPIIRCTSRPS